MSGAPGSEPPAAAAGLAAAQARLVEALVAGAEPPPGFDAAGVEAARRALLNKRAGEVARCWPELAAFYGPRWRTVFADWAYGRPPKGSWCDGLEFAAAHRAVLTGAAAAELIAAETEPAPARPSGKNRRRGAMVFQALLDGAWRAVRLRR